ELLRAALEVVGVGALLGGGVLLEGALRLARNRLLTGGIGAAADGFTLGGALHRLVALEVGAVLRVVGDVLLELVPFAPRRLRVEARLGEVLAERIDGGAQAVDLIGEAVHRAGIVGAGRGARGRGGRFGGFGNGGAPEQGDEDQQNGRV